MPESPIPFKPRAYPSKEWARLLSFARWGYRRKTRRVLLFLWLALIAVDVAIAYRLAWYAPVFSISLTLLWFVYALWSFHRMAIGFAQPTLEDRAMILHGAPFDALRETQRGEVFNQQIRDNLLGLASKDERDAELRLRAEGAAYRILRPSLMVSVLLCWAVCLLGPFAAIRTPLIIMAIFFTWFALMVLVLPTMIRMWSEPNHMGEAHFVNTE